VRAEKSCAVFAHGRKKEMWCALNANSIALEDKMKKICNPTVEEMHLFTKKLC
jgi:hypothetical protein